MTALVALVAVTSAVLAEEPTWNIEAARAGDARFASSLSGPEPYTAHEYHQMARLYAPGLQEIYGPPAIADYWNSVRRSGMVRLQLEESTYERLWTDAGADGSYVLNMQRAVSDQPTSGVVMSRAIYRMLGANGQMLGWIRVVTRWRDCRGHVTTPYAYMCISEQTLQEINGTNPPRDLNRG